MFMAVLNASIFFCILFSFAPYSQILTEKSANIGSLGNLNSLNPFIITLLAQFAHKQPLFINNSVDFVYIFTFFTL